MSRHRLKNVLIAALLLSTSGCTDVDVHRLWSHSRISLKGHFCTEDPQQVVAPIKVLFAIDASASMGVSDRDSARSEAIRQVIDRFRPYRQVSFGILRWSRDQQIDRNPEVCSFSDRPCTGLLDAPGSAFTKDRVILDGAILASQQTGGQRPYIDTLNLIHRLVESDVQLDPELASETKYLVIFFTDGAPCPVEDRGAILEQVDELKHLGEENTAKLMLHTSLLDVWAAPEPGCLNPFDADEILREMAELGRGKFQRFANPSEIDFIPLVQNELETNFELVQVIVENRSARLMVMEDQLVPVPDSDGDGLPDLIEEELGTDPVLADSDGDGCGDKLEVERQGFDPMIPGNLSDPQHCYCPKAERVQDTDGDGLLDCEEFYLGTSKHRFDTDSDLLPDGLEHRGGSNPAESNLGIYDHDEDGFSDWEEVWLHRLPGANESGLIPWPVEFYSYRYAIEQDGPPANGVTCYKVEISNIPLMTTAGSHSGSSPQEGQNDIEITFVQIPEEQQSDEDPGLHNVIRFGRFQQFFFEPELLVPNRQFIPVLPTDLELHR
jgi:hypothetical protein